LSMSQKQLFLEKIYRQLIYAYTIRSSLDQQLKNEIESSEFLAENAEELANLLRDLLDVVDSHITSEYLSTLYRLSETAESKKRTDLLRWDREKNQIERRALGITNIVTGLTPLIKFVMGAKAENNPWAVVALIDRLCRRLYPNARVIVRPRWEHRYSFIDITHKLSMISFYANRRIDGSIHKAFNQYMRFNNIKDALIFSSLAYPPTAAKNFLHIAIWGHEIGHVMDNMEGILTSYASSRVLSPDSMLSVNIAKSSKYKFPTFQLYPNQSAETNLRIILDLRDTWARELFADLLSIRLFGPAALFAMMEFLRPIHEEPITNQTKFALSKLYPPFRYRLKTMFKAYEKWFGSNDYVDTTEQTDDPYIESFNRELSYLRDLTHDRIIIDDFPEPREPGFGGVIRHVVPVIDDLVNEYLAIIEEIFLRKEECFLSEHEFPIIFSGAKDLESGIPPDFRTNENGGNDVGKWFQSIEYKLLSLVVNTGWVYWLRVRKLETDPKRETEKKDLPFLTYGLDYKNIIEEFVDTNELLLKTIENAEAQRWFSEREPFGKNRRGSIDSFRGGEQRDVFDEIPLIPGVLSKKILEYRIEIKRDLIIRPLLDNISQIGTCSIDIRLGNTFFMTRRPMINMLDPTDMEFESKITQFQDKIYLPFGKPFVIHPGQFVLASTLEYFNVPQDLMGLVLDRASWGRLGLVMATSYKVIPGYKGCITLALNNLGNAPILIHPGTRIGQIIFYPISKAPPESG
jgi:dCTP deaminase